MQDTPSYASPMGAPSGQPALSGPTLMLLFADRLLPLKKKQPEHPELVVAFQKVDAKALAPELLACAMWELREQGFVQLEVVQEKVLFVNTTTARVRRMRTGATAGLANALLQQVTDKPKENARSVFDHWFGSEKPDAADWVLAGPRGQAVQLGLFTQVENERHGLVAKVLQSKYHLEPNHAAIAAQEGAFNGFAQRWRAFQMNEPALYQQLVKSASASVSAHQHRADNDNWSM